MNTKLTLLTAAVLLAVPMAFTHDPAGTPKNHCEDPGELAVHDYAPPATGTSVFLLQDGNIVEDCDGDTVPADFDGHLEFAFGGAWILAEGGDGVTGGAIVCYGVPASDHPVFGPFLVVDNALGTGASYLVEADIENLVPPTDPAEPNCGDFTTDVGATCVGVCTVTFPPGLDGAYIVYVTGTAGHICSPAISCPTGSSGSILTPILGECLDLVDNGDADTGRDWIDVIGLLFPPQNPDAQCDDGVVPGTGLLDPSEES